MYSVGGPRVVALPASTGQQRGRARVPLMGFWRGGGRMPERLLFFSPWAAACPRHYDSKAGRRWREERGGWSVHQKENQREPRRISLLSLFWLVSFVVSFLVLPGNNGWVDTSLERGADLHGDTTYIQTTTSNTHTDWGCCIPGVAQVRSMYDDRTQYSKEPPKNPCRPAGRTGSA